MIRLENFRSDKDNYQGFQNLLYSKVLEMSDEIIRWFYKDTDFKRFKGYRLLSVDGTVLEINKTGKLRDEFDHMEKKAVLLS